MHPPMVSNSRVTLIVQALMGWALGRPPSRPAPIIISHQRDVSPRPDLNGCVQPHLVKSALQDLGSPHALRQSPLRLLSVISPDGSAAAELRALLVDVVVELTTSDRPRDAEAGRLLFDYYVKRVGSHEVVMERLHLSRPTFYRRQQRGFVLVAERLDALTDFAARFEFADATKSA